MNNPKNRHFQPKPGSFPETRFRHGICREWLRARDTMSRNNTFSTDWMNDDDRGNGPDIWNRRQCRTGPGRRDRIDNIRTARISRRAGGASACSAFRSAPRCVLYRATDRRRGTQSTNADIPPRFPTGCAGGLSCNGRTESGGRAAQSAAASHHLRQSTLSLIALLDARTGNIRMQLGVGRFGKSSPGMNDYRLRADRFGGRH